MIGVYLQVSFALIFFRSDSLYAAFGLLHDLVGHHGFGHVGSLLEGSLAFALFPVVWFFPNTQQILNQEAGARPNSPAASAFLRSFYWTPSVPWALVMAVLFFAILANLGGNAPFLYFQF